MKWPSRVTIESEAGSVPTSLVPPPFSERGTQTPEKTLEAFAASLSELCYSDALDVRTVLEDFGATHVSLLGYGTTLFSEQHTNALACVHNRRGWLAFRGSDDINDWALNFQFLPGYHVGFRTAWSHINGEVKQWVSNNRNDFDTIVLTGHSLGGALSTYAAYELAQDAQPIEALITFASPRPGSPGFARKLSRVSANLPDHPSLSLGQLTRRFTAPGDIVPRFPPFIFWYSHIASRTEAASPPPVTATYRRTEDGTLKPQKSGFLDRFRRAVVDNAQTPFMMLLGLLFWASDRKERHRMSKFTAPYGSELPLHGAHSRLRTTRGFFQSASLTSKLVFGGVILCGLLILCVLAVELLLIDKGVSPFLIMALALAAFTSTK